MNQTSSASNQEYIPGVCNLGKEETAQRKRPAIVLFVFILITIILIQVFTSSHLWRLLIFFPVAGFAIAFQQWYLKFCVVFGLKGWYNFTQERKVSSTGNKEDLQKDRARVMQMVITGILAGIVAAALYYFLPV